MIAKYSCNKRNIVYFALRMEHVWGIPLVIIYLAIFIYFALKWKHFQDESLNKNTLLLLFSYKIFMGFCITMIYVYYYPVERDADIFKYYNDSAEMTRALFTKPGDFFRMLFGIGNDTDYFTQEYYSKMNHWFRLYETQVYNDNHTMIRLNAVMRLFSFGYYHVHTLFMCFLSFFGMMSFYKGFALFTDKNKHRLLAYALFLFPSLAFWSAGILKEGLMIFALGNIFYAVCLLVQKKTSLFYILLAVFSFVIMLYLKSYALAALGLGLFSLSLAYTFNNRFVGLVYSGIVGMIVCFLYLITYAYPQYNIPEIITQKQVDFTRFSLHMKAGSYFSIGELGGNWPDLLAMSPKAFVTGMFRPMIWEVRNSLMLLNALESLLIITGIILSIVFFKRPEKHQLNMLLCSSMIVIILCTLIGLATANFGSLVRYKVPAIPFIIFMCICLIDLNKIRSLFATKAPRH